MFLSPRGKTHVPRLGYERFLLLLRAMKELLGVLGVIRLNELIKRPQAA